MKQLLGKRIVNVYCVDSSFQQNIHELQDDVEVLVIEAKPLQIENDQIAEMEISNKSIKYKQIIITLTDGENEMLVQLIGHLSIELPPLKVGGKCIRFLS